MLKVSFVMKIMKYRCCGKKISFLFKSYIYVEDFSTSMSAKLKIRGRTDKQTDKITDFVWRRQKKLGQILRTAAQAFGHAGGSSKR